MAKIIDINKHGIRREIDHQFKPKKKGGKKKDRTNAISKEVYRERKESFKENKED
jgi:hypothetical protein